MFRKKGSVTKAIRVFRQFDSIDRWMGGLLIAIMIFNLIDLFATIIFLQTGLVYEANPFMSAVLNVGSIPFAAYKIIIVSMGLWFLWKCRRYQLATCGIIITCLAYFGVVLNHAYILRMVLAHTDMTVSSLVQFG